MMCILILSQQNNQIFQDHKSELLVAAAYWLPNLGNTTASAYVIFDCTSSKSTFPPLQTKTRSMTRTTTRTKVKIMNMPALLVASLIISASVLPFFLFSSMYYSNSLRSLSLKPSKSLDFIFFSLYYCFFLRAGSLAIFSFCYLIFASLSSFYLYFSSRYFFLSSLCLFTACRSQGQKTNKTIELTRPIATPNILSLIIIQIKYRPTHHKIKNNQQCSELNSDFSSPLLLFSPINCPSEECSARHSKTQKR